MKRRSVSPAWLAPGVPAWAAPPWWRPFSSWLRVSKLHLQSFSERTKSCWITIRCSSGKKQKQYPWCACVFSAALQNSAPGVELRSITVKPLWATGQVSIWHVKILLPTKYFADDLIFNPTGANSWLPLIHCWIYIISAYYTFTSCMSLLHVNKCSPVFELPSGILWLFQSTQTKSCPWGQLRFLPVAALRYFLLEGGERTPFLSDLLKVAEWTNTLHYLTNLGEGMQPSAAVMASLFCLQRLLKVCFWVQKGKCALRQKAAAGNGSTQEYI